MENDIVEILTAAIKPLIEAMVNCPEKVKIQIQKSEYNTVFVYITADKPDVGKIIGKQGRHADSIRLLTSAVSAKHKYKAIVEINPSDLKRS